MSKRGRKELSCFGQWNVIRSLGSGGNGNVYLVSNDENQTAALKVLKPKTDHRFTNKAYNRFKSEIDVLQKNSDIEGLLPIIDKHLPDKPSVTNPPWYVMPVADATGTSLYKKDPVAIVHVIISIAKILSRLHSREIAHRDIKPENMLRLADSWCLSDFGLVDFAGKRNLTVTNEEVGARWTKAPEMQRNASKADGRPADIYSLSKTLWMLLANDTKSFEGQYSADSNIGLRHYLPDEHTIRLDTLLKKCTDHDPLKRPTADEFVDALASWLVARESFNEVNKDQWSEVHDQLFPISLPSRAIWTKQESVLKILGLLCSFDDLIYMFYPSGGGMELLSVKTSTEYGCIEIEVSNVFLIIKPKLLAFESFGRNVGWSYFVLETGVLQPCFSVSDFSSIKEDVMELEPGCYVDLSMWERDLDNYDDEVIDRARAIRRYLSGTFLLVAKHSILNHEILDHSGNHNNLTLDEIRSYILEIVKEKLSSMR